jgi:hypothetical protein
MKQIALSFIVGGSLIAGFATAASASGLNSGCPPSYIVWTVGITGSNPPYHAPSLVDKNGDNTVCAFPIDDKTFQFDSTTYQIYNFIDNTGVIA